MTDDSPPPLRAIHLEPKHKPLDSPGTGAGAVVQQGPDLNESTTATGPSGGQPIPGDDVADVLDTTELGLEEEKPYKSVVKREFGRFELLIEMGRGGMAALYLARLRGPEQFEKFLAIKRIHEHLSDQREFVDMFLDEARIAALIHHPNVATIFEFGALDESYFIAMEYVHGQNLTDILKAAQRLPDKFHWPMGVRIVSDVAKGLHAAHELHGSDGESLGVVHRDVSPQNIIVSYDGHVKVVDFGIAYAAEKVAHTAAGMLKGKAAYMSPEQTQAEDLDRRSDIFALGTVLFEAVTHRRLFKEKNEAATIMRVREAEVPSARSLNPAIPSELDKIIRRALALKPEDRYKTAEDLADHLDELLAIEGQLVSRQKVETLMDDLFFDRRKIKDEQIRNAAKATATEPMMGVAMAGTSSISLLSNRIVVAAGLSGRSKTVMIAAAALVVLGVSGVILWGALGKSKEAPSTPKSSASGMDTTGMRSAGVPAHDTGPADMRPTRSAFVKIKFTVTPQGAPVTIRLANKTYRGSLTEVTLARSTRAVKAVIRAKGYQSETVFVVPSESSEIPVVLKPAPRIAPMVQPRIRPMVRPMVRPRWRPMRRPMRRPKLRDPDGW